MGLTMSMVMIAELKLPYYNIELISLNNNEINGHML